MALLTAEDVLNKAFSKTKYREGFDQDEVDDFLDEVANTIAQLTAERDELAARLAAGGGAPAAEAPPVTAAGGVPGTTGLLAAATEVGGASATGMLAMAQKLHDEYVQAGEAERDRIIDEANAAADQIRERAGLDAKARMEELAAERASIEARIDDLRRFERDYRARLKAYLENLLGDLDHTATGPSTGAVAGLAGSGIADLPGASSPVSAASAPEPADEAPEAAAAAAPEASPEPAAEAPSEAPEPAAAPAVEPAPAAPQADAAPAAPQVDAAPAAPQADAVSFEEAIGGFSEPAAETPASAQAPVPPTYDANEPWENQLRAPASGPIGNPFAPVTTPAPEDQQTGAVPAIDESAEGDETPFTPPSSRMFSDLYGQKSPESGN